jgi:tagatose-1,6-bisphosphate aldolase non-catalytic subunit AgaZ/GatZ
MNSTAHALVSVLVGVAAVVASTPPVHPVAVVAIAVVVGVGIDFDHFLIARYNAGDWRALGACLRDPRMVLFDQGAIFGASEVDAVERLVTHLVIGGVAVALLWLASPYLAVLVAATLYAHVLADVVSTARSAVVLDADEVPEAVLEDG